MKIPKRKIYVSGKTQIEVDCHECYASKTFDIESIGDYGKFVKVRCGCRHVFSVMFETRACYRKEVNLFGTCRKVFERVDTNIIVLNISRSGIGFEMTPDKNQVSVSDLKEGDFLQIEFTLDNKRKASVSTNVVVKSVDGAKIGAEFHQPSIHVQKIIGFYLM